MNSQWEYIDLLHDQFIYNVRRELVELVKPGNTFRLAHYVELCIQRRRGRPETGYGLAFEIRYPDGLLYNMAGTKET